MKKIFFGITLIFTSCTTYHFNNGDKFRNFFPVKDEYIVTSEELENYKFDISNFKTVDKKYLTQFIFPGNVKDILKTVDRDLFVIFYFPNCSGAGIYVDVAKFAEDRKIPFLLISNTYSPKRMTELYTTQNLENNNLYIIPTVTKQNNKLLRKQLNFLHELDPAFYSKYGEELIFPQLFVISKDGQMTAKPKQITNIDWIKEIYRIEDE